MKKIKKTILVTGGAGFIGSNLVEKLLKLGSKIIVIDNFNDYYNPKIKEKNIKNFFYHKNFSLIRGDILDNKKLKNCFKNHVDVVIHLAARAGVRPSITQPEIYIQNNVIGTLRLLEKSVENKVNQFIFAGSSSVYGNSNKTPFNENQLASPISPYGASKMSAETLCKTYSNLYQLKTTVLRLFTVFGPKGRPDMAPYLFSKAIISGKKITKFGTGNSERDYTYIDDIVNGFIKAIDKPFDFEIINLGCDKPISLNKFIQTIETITNKKAIIKQINNQKGDSFKTNADISKAKKLLDWSPRYSLYEGLVSLIGWIKTKS